MSPSRVIVCLGPQAEFGSTWNCPVHCLGLAWAWSRAGLQDELAGINGGLAKLWPSWGLTSCGNYYLFAKESKFKA